MDTLPYKASLTSAKISIASVSFFIIEIALCRLLPEFEGPVAAVPVIAIIGIAGYLVFLATIDVPMYLTRWQVESAASVKRLSPLEGLRDASVRWVVTRDIAFGLGHSPRFPPEFRRRTNSTRRGFASGDRGETQTRRCSILCWAKRTSNAANEDQNFASRCSAICGRDGRHLLNGLIGYDIIGLVRAHSLRQIETLRCRSPSFVIAQ